MEEQSFGRLDLAVLGRRGYSHVPRAITRSGKVSRLDSTLHKPKTTMVILGEWCEGSRLLLRKGERQWSDREVEGVAAAASLGVVLPAGRRDEEGFWRCSSLCSSSACSSHCALKLDCRSLQRSMPLTPTAHKGTICTPNRKALRISENGHCWDVEVKCGIDMLKCGSMQHSGPDPAGRCV